MLGVLVAAAAAQPAPEPAIAADCDLPCEVGRRASWTERRGLLELAIADGGDRRRLLGGIAALDALRELDVDDGAVVEACLRGMLSEDAARRTEVMTFLRAAVDADALAALLTTVAPPVEESDPVADPPLEPEVEAPPVFVGGLPLATTGGLAETVLENGVRITVVGDPALPLVAVVHRVDAGAADEALGEPGFAHLVEHLMFDESFDAFVEASHGIANAWTTHDATTYLSQVAPESLLPLFDLEVGRFSSWAPSPTVLERERLVVADEDRLRFSLDPRVRLEVAIDRALLADHPYGRPVSGGLAIAGAAPEALGLFREQRYVGGRLHVVVVGPHAPVPVAEALAARYGALRGGEGERSTPPVTLTGAPRVRIEVDGLRANEIGLAWALPSGRPCPAEGPPSGPCTATYWTDQVVLALFATEGADAIERQVSTAAGAFTDVRVRLRQDAAGGWVALTAKRRPWTAVAANNVGGGLVQVLGGALGIPVPWWYVSSPGPGTLERTLADDPTWVTDDAILLAREAVLRDELAKLWRADARAMGLARKTALGLDADESVARRLAEVDAAEVRARYGEIFREEAVVVRVR